MTNFLFTDSVVHNIVLRNVNELKSQYHQTYYLPQNQSQLYYSQLIHILTPSNKHFILFGEKSTFNNLSFFQQNNKNVISIIRYNFYIIPIIIFFRLKLYGVKMVNVKIVKNNYLQHWRL